MQESRNDQERRIHSRLTDEELEEIARRAAEIVQSEFYVAVGKNVISKALYVVGAALLAAAAYLDGAGKVKLGG